MAQAGLALDEPRYLDAAARAMDYLLAWWREGQAAHPGKLDDYAFCVWGLLEFYGATFQTEYLAEAQRLAELMLAQFFDGEDGGFYPYALAGEPFIILNEENLRRGPDVGELRGGAGAVASGSPYRGNSLACRRRLVVCLSVRRCPRIPRRVRLCHVAFLEESWSTAELVSAARTMPEELIAFLREASRPESTVLVKTPETAKTLEKLAPFTSAYPIPQKGAQYYLCQNGACAQPVGSVAQMKIRLEKMDSFAADIVPVFRSYAKFACGFP